MSLLIQFIQYICTQRDQIHNHQILLVITKIGKNFTGSCKNVKANNKMLNVKITKMLKVASKLHKMLKAIQDIRHK